MSMPARHPTIPADDLLYLKTDPEVGKAIKTIDGKIGIVMADIGPYNQRLLREVNAAHSIISRLHELSHEDDATVMQFGRRFEKEVVGWALQRLETYMPELPQQFALLRDRFDIPDKGYDLSHQLRQRIRSFAVPKVEGHSAG